MTQTAYLTHKRLCCQKKIHHSKQYGQLLSIDSQTLKIQLDSCAESNTYKRGKVKRELLGAQD